MEGMEGGVEGGRDGGEGWRDEGEGWREEWGYAGEGGRGDVVVFLWISLVQL